MNKKVIVTGFLIFLILSPFFVVEAQKHFPIPKHKRINEIAQMLPSTPQGLGHPISDRDFWDTLSGTKQAENVIQKANILLSASSLPVNKEQWMAYVEGKTNRQNYMDPFHEQGRRFNTLVLAEVLENKGRFIGKIEEILQHMLSLGTWKKPQSYNKVDKDYWYGRKHFVDLAIAQRSFNVATADYWLQDKLDPDLRKKLREYIKKDALDPYLEKINTLNSEWQWMTASQNWNSVCTAGVVGAALSIIKDREERANIIAGAEIGMDYYLKEFGDDGYCSEGVSYWGYGFGHFLVLNEIIRVNTEDKIDWLDDTTAARAALFPGRAEILNAQYPSFSDAPGIYSRPSRWLKDYAERRMGLSQNDASASLLRTEKLDDLTELYYQGMLQLNKFPVYRFKEELFEPGYHVQIRDFFPSGGLLIARPWRLDPRGMAVSIKGGNNAEEHNHNDLGTFEVVLESKKLVIDPGKEIYGRHTFTEDRYKSEMMNSYGHSTPVVAGHLQSPGKDAKAIITEKHFSLPEDFIKYNLKSAYNVSSLQNLTRSFTYSRGDTSKLIVKDEVSFTQPEKFEIALIVDTYNQAIRNRLSCRWKLIGPNTWLIEKGDRAIKVVVSSPGNNIVFKEKPVEAFRMPKGYNPIRLGFALKGKVTSATLKMEITPVGDN